VCALSFTAALSCLVMSVQLRLLAKAPGSLRPSVPELATALAELASAAGLDGLTGPALEATAGDVVAADPMAADAVGPPPALFEVHALSKASAMQAVVAIAQLGRR
jgi:hypothetical protein